MAPPASAGLREFARLVANPLVVILLFASVISGAVGQLVNAVVIGAMVLLGVLLGWTQSVRAHRAAEQLRLLVTPTATVLRDGSWLDIARKDVVVGDLVRLNAGDVVPADARLLESRDLHVQEAILTGESLPVEKAVAGAATASERTEHTERVYFGTSVTSGAAVASVYATGPRTEAGRISASLARPAPETAFDRGTRQFGFFIARAVVFLVLFVSVVNIALHRDPLDSLLFAIALAVGLTPEYLPVIMSITLARGASKMARGGVIVKSLGSIQNLGSMDVLCSDKTNTLTSGAIELERSVDISGRESAEPLRLAALNASYQTGLDSGLDRAILASLRPDTASTTKIDEMPFDFARRRASVVLSSPSGPIIITKGAPEDVVAVCALDDDARAAATRTVDALSQAGLRVLAVASRSASKRDAYSVDEERDLTLAGFVAFADPPIPGTAAQLAALRADGVDLKILSGDHELVLRHVCEALGVPAERIVTGSEIERMDDRELAEAVAVTSAFARVRPEQKERVIAALRRQGHVVGYLGDGVNDAPSMHAADIGISVEGGVDTAKEAADVILHTPGLEIVHDGIVAGRAAFGNVVKYLLMGTSSDFGNMLSMAAASAFLPFLPMRPTQILLNDLLYDVVQMGIPTDAVDPSYVRKPRRWDIGLIRRFMFTLGPVSSIYDIATFGLLFWLFRADEALFQSGWFVESLATQTLVVFVIRTAGNPLRSRPGRALMLLAVAAVALAVLLPYGPLAADLGLVALPLSYLALLVVLVASYLAIVELVKRRVFAADERSNDANATNATGARSAPTSARV
jgi:Mg2+-importing ATPase